MSDPQLGVCLAAFADQRFEDALASVTKLGLAVVDLPTDSLFAMTRDRPAPAELRRRVDHAGIEVACVSNSRDTQLLLGPHGPHTDGVAPGPPAAKVAHAQAAAQETIELAATLGARYVRLMLGCPDFARWMSWTASDVGWSDNVDAFVAAAVPLARTASDAGVLLCIEPHVKQVAFDAPSWSACLAGVQAAGADIGLCFDAANIAALGFDPVEFLTATGSMPACVHAKDVERSRTAVAPDGPGWVRYGPQPAIRFRAVPWGEVDWPAVGRYLGEVGFTGPILIEHEDLLIDPAQGVDGARRFLDGLGASGSGSGAWW
jgi:sugar phosphate isomerase/epimerase